MQIFPQYYLSFVSTIPNLVANTLKSPIKQNFTSAKKKKKIQKEKEKQKTTILKAKNLLLYLVLPIFGE